jgi:hypothetical protein
LTNPRGRRRPRFCCFPGSFRASRRQMRATRLWFTRHPSAPQHRRDPSIAVAAKACRQANDRLSERLFVIGSLRQPPLGRAMLMENAASPAFRDVELAASVGDEIPPARRPYQFPEAASVRIILSRVRSATAFFNRAFSASSSFKRRAWSRPSRRTLSASGSR